MIRLLSALVAFAFTATVFAQATAPARPVSPEAPSKAQEEMVYVRFETTRGNIDLELNKNKAPITVENFLAYVESGHFAGTIFHRVIPNFVVQGGGMTPDMKPKPTKKPIKNEVTNGLRNLRGTLSMARTNQLDSATSQFFINLKDNPSLDIDGGLGGYAVFGRVVAGMDLVDTMPKEPTTTKGGHRDVPVNPVEVKSAKVITKDEVGKAAKPADAPAAKPAAPPATAPAAPGSGSGH